MWKKDEKIPASENRASRSRFSRMGVSALAVSIFLGGSLSSIGYPDAVRAGGYPVIDSSSLAQIQTMVTQGKAMVSELNEVKGIMGDMLSAFGEFGVMSDVLSGTAFKDSGSSSDFYTNMANFGFDPCAINLCQSGDNPSSFSDMVAARDWTMKNFFSSVPLDSKAQKNMNEVRRRAIVYAASTAMGLSKTIHNELVASGGTVRSLEGIVTSATDLRGDVRANSAIALAHYKAQLQQIALLTSLVDVAATKSLSDSGFYDPEGGKSVPVALVESDFIGGNVGENRVSVTQPKRGSASGGSSPFGGSLLSAALGGNFPASVSAALGGTPLGAIISESGALEKVSRVAGVDITKGALFSDTLGVAGQLLRQRGAGDIANSIDLVSRGIGAVSRSGKDSLGAFEALMGVGSMVARQTGNEALSQSINTAGSMIRGNGSAIDFARNVALDLGSSDPSAASWVQGRISAFQNGSLSPESLLLDATYAAARQSDGSGNVARVLQGDPAGMSIEDVVALGKQALDLAGSVSGNTAVKDLSRAVSSVSNDQIETLARAVAESSAPPAPNSASSQSDLLRK